ncbi:MAG TPA: glycosyltransferase [Magnetospirillum sp.]|nr:glycosyltransferase [Magnetospirillum sp.]
MMRVLQVYSEFHPQASGVARHMDGLARALAGQGVAVEVAALAVASDLGPRPYGVTRLRLGDLPAAVRRAEVVHAHGSRTLAAALALGLARALGKPSVFTPHCYYDAGSLPRRLAKRVWDRTVESLLARWCGAMILLHQGWLDDIRQRGLRPRRTLVVPNCIDADALGERQDAAGIRRLDGAPAILSVGRLDPVKRLDDVIRALAQPGLAGAVLHVVGTGPDAERLHHLAQAPDVAGRVRFHGWQDDMAAAAMMAGCDVMVLASEREGLPTVLLEALLAGVPMVHSDIAGCMAIADEVGWNGGYPLGDVAALAARLAGLAGGGVPAQVSARVRARFSWQGRGGEILDLYRSLMAGR